MQFDEVKCSTYFHGNVCVQESVKWKLVKCGEEKKDESTLSGEIVEVKLRSPPAVR